MASYQMFLYSLSVVIFLTVDSTHGSGLDEAFLRYCANMGRLAVDRAIMETRTALLDRKPKTPNDLLTLFRFPSQETVELARAEEIFQATLDIIRDHDVGGMQSSFSEEQTSMESQLTDENIRYLMALSGCTDVTHDVTCQDSCKYSKYRTANGVCNNVDKPTQGATLTPFARFLDPKYEDHFNDPIGWANTRGRRQSLPSPRLVSTVVGSTDTITDDSELSNFVMFWGQFLDHDLDLTPHSPSSVAFKDGVRCNETCENSAPCFPIQVPADDPRIHEECLTFIRSSAVCGSGYRTGPGRLVPREQINAITSYIDGSQIYGSSQTLADNLRAFDGKGRLRTNSDTEVPTGRSLLPYDPDSPMACLSESSSAEVPCFLAGDVRSNEQVALTSVHTLLLREHNRVSERLSDVNPHWDDEKLYQEARKIVGAELQHIVFGHYLPKVLGPQGMQRLGDYQGYDPDVDASIANVFATGAFRFGHGTVRPVIPRLQANFQSIPEGNLPLHLAFFQPWRLVEQGGIEPILRGFFAVPAKQLIPDEIMTDELTERLFELAETVALDLMALNIQRGRDHGLPSYYWWRKRCGLKVGNTFRHLRGDISKQSVLDKLQELYQSPKKIDLFIGAMAEDPLPGGILGPTFTCLLADQFQRTRAGDRFWYENQGVFAASQLAEIKKQSLARIICDNTGIDQVQADVFLSPTNESLGRPLLNCNDIAGMDLSVWTQTVGSHTSPTITCPDDVNVNGNNAGAVVTWTDPIGTDSSGTAIDVTCSHTSGSRFPPGVTSVTCSTFDPSSNCASCSFSVIVTI